MLAMLDDDDRKRFWPRSFAYEPVDDPPVTILNEPPLPDNVTSMPIRQRSLHATLCEALTNTQALLARLEAGVRVPQAEHRELVRALYVATRRQLDALSATLGVPGLE